MVTLSGLAVAEDVAQDVGTGGQAIFEIHEGSLKVRPQGYGVAPAALQRAYLDGLERWAMATTPDDQRRAAVELSNLQHAALESFNGTDVFEYLQQHPQAALDLGGPEPVPGTERLVDSVIFTGFDCLRDLEQYHLDHLSRFEPTAKLALAELSRQLLEHQLTAPRRLWLVSYSRRRVESSITWTVQSSADDLATGTAARQAAARQTSVQDAQGSKDDRTLLWISYADVLQRSGFYELGQQSVGALERSLKLSPEHGVARYWAGLLAEKYALRRRAIGHFQLLVNGFVDPSLQSIYVDEGRLRLAVNHLRAGKRRLGEDGLAQVARNAELRSGEQWLRRVAYQEWVRYLLQRDAARAPEVLAEALEAFADDSTLQLLAAHQRQLRNWQDGLDAVQTLSRRSSRVSATDRAAAPGQDSARWRYEGGRREGLDVNAQLLQRRSLVWRQSLKRSLAGLEEMYLSGTRRPEFDSCGVLPVDRWPVTGGAEAEPER